MYKAIPPPCFPQMAAQAAAAAQAGAQAFAAAAAGGGLPAMAAAHAGPNGGGSWRPGGWRARAMAGGCGPGMMNRGEGGGHCKLAARFVRDVTVFDGTQMAPGTPFTKIWRLKNVGEMPWPAGTKMLFVGGDQMTTEMSVPLTRDAPVQPGEEVDVAVEMK